MPFKLLSQVLNRVNCEKIIEVKKRKHKIKCTSADDDDFKISIKNQTNKNKIPLVCFNHPIFQENSVGLYDQLKYLSNQSSIHFNDSLCPILFFDFTMVSNIRNYVSEEESYIAFDCEQIEI